MRKTLFTNSVAQSVSAASCGSVSLPAGTPGGTPGELAGGDGCATSQAGSNSRCAISKSWSLPTIFLLCAFLAIGRGEAIHDATVAGDWAKVQALLSSSPGATAATNAEGNTALHLAARLGQLEIAALLIASNAPVNATNLAGLTPLALAARTRHSGMLDSNSVTSLLSTRALRPFGDSSEVKLPLAGMSLTNWIKQGVGVNDPTEVVSAKTRIVELLLAHGASVTNAAGFSEPLVVAAINAEGKILRMLLQHGGRPDQLDPSGARLIHFATMAGNYYGVAALIEAGAEVNPAGFSGVTPLLLACDLNDEPLVRLLLKAGAKVDRAADKGKLPLHGALESGNEGIVALLLERTTNVNARYSTQLAPLHLAANLGSTKLMAMLLNKGAEVDAMDAEGFTPLLSAIERGHRAAADLLVARGANPLATASDLRDALQLATRDNRVELMQWAFDHGCEVNRRDRWSMTALHIAALQGHRDAVAWLVSHGANLKARTTKLNFALHVAADGPFLNRILAEEARTNQSPRKLPPVGTPEDYVATAALLLTNGVSVNAENADLMTPLHLAAGGSPGVVNFLLQHGADVNARDKFDFTALERAAQFGEAETAELLLAKGADLNATQANGFNALFCAAHNGNTAVLKVLLSHKCDVRIRDENQATALHWAVVGGHLAVAAPLVEAGAEVNATDRIGHTPLHVAAGMGKMEFVEWLLAHGADCLIEDRSGAKPADLAAKNGFPEIAKLLRLPPEARSR